MNQPNDKLLIPLENSSPYDDTTQKLNIKEKSALPANYY